MRLFATCLFCVLLVVAVNAGASGPQMFEDFISAKDKAASVMSEQYYQDSKVVEFHTGSFSHCATTHWWSTLLTTTTLTCPAHEGHRGTNAFIFKSPVGTCEWQIDYLTAALRGGLPVAQTNARKLAKVEAKCVFPDSIDSCGYGSGYGYQSADKQHGHVTIHIDGWLYKTPAAFRTRYRAPILNDDWGCDSDVPSCCMLGRPLYRLARVSQERCQRGQCLVRGMDQVSGMPFAELIANGTTSDSSQRIDEEEDDDEDSGPDNSGAEKPPPELGNGNGYYTGWARIVSGTVTAEHPGGHHKWETGMMNWVVGTFKKRGTGWTEGYPPDDLFPAEAGKFTLKFDQKSDYDYDYYQAPPHKDERPHRRSYGEPDYQRY